MKKVDPGIREIKMMVDIYRNGNFNGEREEMVLKIPDGWSVVVSGNSKATDKIYFPETNKFDFNHRPGDPLDLFYCVIRRSHEKKKVLVNKELTKDEKSLLLYFETCAVDQKGRVEIRLMNDEDKETSKKWDETGFVQFGRIASEYINKTGYGKFTHWCYLSDDAWAIVSRLRKERAERLYKNRNWLSTKEVRFLNKVVPRTGDEGNAPMSAKETREALINKTGYGKFTHWCYLSDDAWAIVSRLRKERAERLYKNRNWLSTKEVRFLDKVVPRTGDEGNAPMSAKETREAVEAIEESTRQGTPAVNSER